MDNFDYNMWINKKIDELLNMNVKSNGIYDEEVIREYLIYSLSVQKRRELFEFALKNTGLSAKQVIHIGDSLSSDIKGASSVGINAIWINRTGKAVSKGVNAVENLLQIYDSGYFTPVS